MPYDITALKRKMLIKYPFFGSVVTNVNYKENEEIATAGTDGETIYYNPNFLENLSIEEQVFIFAHEVCHIAFNHILRSEGKDVEIWNIATDAVINAFLRRDGLKMVDGGVDIQDAIKYDAEQLYDKLLKEKRQQSQQNSQSEQSQSGKSNKIQNNSQGQQNSSSSGDKQNNEEKDQSSSESGSNSEDKAKEDVGHDTHSLWQDAIKKKKENQGKKEYKDEVEKTQEEAQNLGEKKSFEKNTEEKKKNLEELRESIVKEASQAGSHTNGEIRGINDIGRSRPLIDWRYFLREAINYDVDWSYKNVYIENGVVNATFEEKPTPETEIVLDTSGSIDENLLKNFLRECKNIFMQSRVKVGCFDTKFYGFHDIHTEKDIDNMEFMGGGGTNFDVAVGAFTKRVENKIIFTDGVACMPQVPVDAIWIVFGKRKINPPGGKVIYIDEHSLERLCYNTNYHIGKSK